MQQSSLFGLASSLPKAYTQAASGGIAVAGVFTGLMRVFTKAFFHEERDGAIAFFVIALLIILIGIVCQVFLRFSPFVKHQLGKKLLDTEHLKKESIVSNIELKHIEDFSRVSESSVVMKRGLLGKNIHVVLCPMQTYKLLCITVCALKAVPGFD